MAEHPTAKDSQLAKPPVEDSEGRTPLRWYAGEPDPEHQAAGSVAGGTDHARHVWVRPEHLRTEMPGLVLDWRQTPDWEALVTWVEPRGRVVTDWVKSGEGDAEHRVDVRVTSVLSVGRGNLPTMSQSLLHVMPAQTLEATLRRRLEGAGFRTTPSGRMSGGIHVRVRENTGDEAEVRRIVDEVAPGAEYGPAGSPTHDVVDYRKGK